MSPSPSSIVQQQKKLRILFYHAGGQAGWVYTAVLQLKTYIDLYYPAIADQVQWLVPLQQNVSDDELVTHIKGTNTNVLCTSHYLWNHKFLTDQLARIKPQLPSNVKIIAGGPNIDANTNKNFFDQYPFIDYAVYSAGEQAFADIVNHLVLDQPLIAFNTSNCAWKHHQTGRPVVADYKFVKMIEVSPFVHNKTLFKAMVQDAKKKNIPIWLPYTLTRGCPYACSFCDWNSGLGNKVSRRKNTYQQEIDLFQQLGVTNIYLSDANVGQYDEDVEMIKYFGQKNLQENAGFHVGGNFSKLKKENNLQIFHNMIRGKLVNKTINFSIQDINKDVLKNIDRPDVGWETHCSMAKELQTTYPDIVIKAQIIYGLPGQTVASWRETLLALIDKNIFPMVFINEPLPNSPAMYDPSYQDRFAFEYVETTRWSEQVLYTSMLPRKCYSFDQHDLVHMMLLSNAVQSLFAIKILEPHLELDCSACISSIMQDSTYLSLHEIFYKKWSESNAFYFDSKGMIIGEFEMPGSRCGELSLQTYFLKSVWFAQFIAQFLPIKQRQYFSNRFKDKVYWQWMNEFYIDVD